MHSTIQVLQQKTKQSILLLGLIFFTLAIFAQAPAGYYNAANGLSCAQLKTALKNIITAGNTARAYGDLWTQYQLTDIKPRTIGTGSANVIYDIYSAKPGQTDPYQYTPGTHQCGSYSAENNCYNREHSVPQSWFNGNTAVPGPTTDYLHIFPTDGWVNGKRANFIYGEVASSSFTSLNGSKLGTSSIAGFTGSVFEPIDSFKGDVARAFLYFVTRYQDDMPTYALNAEAAQSFEGNTFPSVKIEYLKLMIKWHNNDPVSEKERTRNNGAYAFQGNRNPYIDNPSYVNSVWNSTCPGLSALPVDILFFAGKLDGSMLNLTWEVGTEINLKQYEVEESLNGINFKTIHIQEAQQLKNYAFSKNMELLRGRRIYYRIKKVDLDGKSAYSDVFTIHLPLNVKFEVYPNPVKNQLTLRFNNNANESAQLEVIDLVGKTILSKKVLISNGVVNTNIESLSNGTYFVKLNYRGEMLTARIIVDK
ncbi:MAG: endonuclease [Chitinophagaceae bacterium]|nr:endonuclease [Chitinophagaceae bacterium]